MVKTLPRDSRQSWRTKLALHRARVSGRHQDNVVVLAVLVTAAGVSALLAAAYAAGWVP